MDEVVGDEDVLRDAATAAPQDEEKAKAPASPTTPQPEETPKAPAPTPTPHPEEGATAPVSKDADVSQDEAPQDERAQTPSSAVLKANTLKQERADERAT